VPVLLAGFILLVIAAAFVAAGTPLLAPLQEAASDFLEEQIGLAAPVHVAMSVYGTIPARLLLMAVLVAAVAGVALVLRKVVPERVWPLAVLAASAAIFFVMFRLLPPLSLQYGAANASMRLAAAAAVGSTLVLAVAWSAIAWASRRFNARRDRLTYGALAFALVGACGFAALVPHGYRLHQLTGLIVKDDAVRIVIDASVNGIYVDDARRRMYATGNGADRVVAFPLDDISAAPLAGEPGSGGSESLAFNEPDNEIYIFANQSLRVLDADTLRTKEEHSFPMVSPGDARPMWDGATQRLLVTSEADEIEGKPLIVLQRDGWKMIADEDLMVGNAVRHPDRSRFYLSFFRYSAELIAYDVDDLKIGTQVSTHSKRFDRLEFDKERNEVFVTAPMEGVVYRFDADTLAAKGSFRSDFGCRSLAVDEPRQIMLCASLLSNNLVAIDLKTYEVVASYRLGPWLRTVVIDGRTSRAYVSSAYGIYSVDYTSRLPKAGS